MMNWYSFEIYGSLAIFFWLFGFIVFSRINSNSNLLLFAGMAGTITIGVFIIVLWYYLDRPPMRTLAETRIWYTFFLSLIGNIIYLKWKYSWFYLYAHLLAALFIVINIINPETYNKSLLPALQSIWFIPHVVVYMIAYAFLASSFIISIIGIVKRNTELNSIIQLADNVVYIGFGFLSMGLIFGALWAKKAWGHYWTWDPKETWAFITWVAYLIYIHNRSLYIRASKNQLFILFFAFILLLICWFGVQFLPSAVNSVHNYAS